jgi:hypothetical protein
LLAELAVWAKVDHANDEEIEMAMRKDGSDISVPIVTCGRLEPLLAELAVPAKVDST